MIFTESLSDKLIFFIEKVDPKIVKKFIVGFYQISNREVSSKNSIDLDLIDTYKLKNKIIDFLENMHTSEREQYETIPTEEIAYFLTQIGHIYSMLMRIEEGMPFYKASIKIREKYLKEEGIENAENYLGVGSIYEQGGSFKEALPYYKKALEIRKEFSYVENNLLIAESYGQMAMLYYHMNQYATALSYISKSIHIREKLLPSNHALLEASYYNYKIIEKASQPKKEYLKIIFGTLSIGLKAIINRLVGQK